MPLSDIPGMMCHSCGILQPCLCENSWARSPPIRSMSEAELREEAKEWDEYYCAEFLGEIRREYKQRMNKRLARMQHAI